MKPVEFIPHYKGMAWRWRDAWNAARYTLDAWLVLPTVSLMPLEQSKGQWRTAVDMTAGTQERDEWYALLIDTQAVHHRLVNMSLSWRALEIGISIANIQDRPRWDYHAALWRWRDLMRDNTTTFPSDEVRDAFIAIVNSHQWEFADAFLEGLARADVD